MADAPPLLFERRLGGKRCAVCDRVFTRSECPRRSYGEFARQRFCSKSCAAAGKGGGPEARFADSYAIDANGCWNWTKSTYGYGYGTFCAGGTRVAAHRYSYERANGCTVPDGMVVMHKCDNPRCVNPDHLSIGSQLENLRDATRKGRVARGSRSHWAKLTEEQARAIKESEEAGSILALRYGVSASVVSGIRNGAIWRHI